MSEYNGNGSKTPLDPWRITTLFVIAVLVLGAFVIRLFDFQILQRDTWIEEAEVNRTQEISVPTQRGVIYDRNGIILARNVAAYNVAITPAFLPDDAGEIEEIARQLSELTDVPLNLGSINDPLIPCGENLGINQMIAIGDSFAPFTPVLIKCDVDRELAFAIQEEAIDWPGVSIEIESIRDYPTGELTSTVIGFLGPIPANQEEQLRELGFLPGRDKIGYAGVELFFQDLLSGINGERVVEVDVGGQILRDVEAPVDPEPGLNLVLTIDTRLQQAVDAIVDGEVNFWNTFFGQIRISSGVAIVVNPQTGEVLAMISWPTYENNRLARFIPAYYYEQLIADSTQPLLNHAVGAELPAGSVFKLVTAVGALNEGVVTPEQVIETPGLITVTERYFANDPGNAREFVDWNPEGFGSLNFLGGISNSSNVYFYKLGGGFGEEVPNGGLGICRLGTYARALGYGGELGIELPDETDGLIPSPTWKRRTQGENWSTGDTYISSVGQGYVIAAPMQVLMSAATVANDGVLMRPTLIREVVDGEGNVIEAVMDELGNLFQATLDGQGNILEVTPPGIVSFEGFYEDNDGNIDGYITADGERVDLIVVSPFLPDPKWDLTSDPIIESYENPGGIGSCRTIVDEDNNPQLNTVQPWVFETIQNGMRLAVTSGTLADEFENVTIPTAGKTGTAEYCDAVALSKNLCIPGNWPTHSWTVAYAPFDNPEIAVVSFMYNGGEGASVAGPVVRKIIEAYFELKAIDAALGNP